MSNIRETNAKMKGFIHVRSLKWLSAGYFNKKKHLNKYVLQYDVILFGTIKMCVDLCHFKQTFLNCSIAISATADEGVQM